MNTFKTYQHQRILLPDCTFADGTYVIDGDITIRVKNGFLNDGTDENGKLRPAIETSDGSHIEHWKDGVLHCETEPAVIDNIDNYEEWWLDGKIIRGNQAQSNDDENELVININYKLEGNRAYIKSSLLKKIKENNLLKNFFD